MKKEFIPLEKRVCRSEPVFNERLIEVQQGFNLSQLFAKMVQLGDVNNAFSRSATYHGDRDRAIELINQGYNLKAPLYMEPEEFFDNEKHISAIKKALVEQNRSEVIERAKKDVSEKASNQTNKPSETTEGEHASA